MIPEINELTKAAATITFRRDDGTLYTLDELPPAFTYRIDDAETGAEVVPPTVATISANPHKLIIAAVDNRILNPANRRELRRVTVIVTDLATTEILYRVINLAKVPAIS